MASVTRHLPKNQFRSVIRMIRLAPVDRVETLIASAADNMKRLRTKADENAAVQGVPKGADQWNVGNVVRWMEKLTKADEKAIGQMVKIHATCEARLLGK